MLLLHLMLRANREVIIKVKHCLLKAIAQLALRYPEPTLENCLHPNTKLMIKIWDKFFEYQETPENVTNVLTQTRTPLFQAIRRIMICEYEHDPYYRYRMDWFIEQIIEANKNGQWAMRPRYGREIVGWKEPIRK
jgi:hypothetical protein